jgi:signal transduction histidine kinase
MVAGVSHELNTPIGNALMASTTVHSHLETLLGRFSSGALKRSEFEALLRSAEEANRLSTASIARAAELVASFKQVAVDRVSERRREFALAELVEDTLATLRPGLKARPWRLSSEVPAGLVLDSYPGPLGQVLTNLVQNAVVHAFDDRDRGEVRVTAREEGGWIELVVSDDGVGMPPATLAHIFEPFFTTRLGRGGSGLGLAICHRLATRVLGGELTAASRPGEGSEFRLRLPRIAPGEVAAARSPA